MILLQHYQCTIKEMSICHKKELGKGTVMFFTTHNLMFIEALCALYKIQCILLIFYELFANLSGTVLSE